MKSEHQIPFDGFKKAYSARKLWLLSFVSSAVVLGLYCILQLPVIGEIAISADDSLCPIVPKVDASRYVYSNESLERLVNSRKFKLDAAQLLSDAIKIPTEVYDGMVNPGSVNSTDELYKLEPLWENFERFHAFLKKSFPLVHKKLKLEKVNTFGLIYTWKGSSPDLKPLMLTAHQDVVPVQKETIKDWKFPPFDGVIDDDIVYGRGAADCKNLLIGLLHTVEILLEEDQFKPHRTIILAFGYDEESQSTGAAAIGEVILNRYGPKGLYAIIDEGDDGFEEIGGRNFILPATGEKGYVDSTIDLYTTGGHSSVPPQHTAIGIISKLISLVESEQYSSIITNVNPVLGQLQCLAEHGHIDKELKSNILKAHLDVNANKKLLEYMESNLATKFLVQTSQAVDVIQGGAKSNALPEHVSVVINQRIAVEETVKSTTDKIIKQLKQIADEFDLGITVQDEVVKESTKHGYFHYRFVDQLQPAPVTPTSGPVWDTLGGSLRYLYENLLFPETEQEFIFASSLSTGNTDTKNYWELTDHIYRYLPGVPFKDPSDGFNEHTVNEKVPVDGHAAVISFYYFYLQVVDVSKDI